MKASIVMESKRSRPIITPATMDPVSECFLGLEDEKLLWVELLDGADAAEEEAKTDPWLDETPRAVGSIPGVDLE
jgi:hypothetical protein